MDVIGFLMLGSFSWLLSLTQTELFDSNNSIRLLIYLSCSVRNSNGSLSLCQS